MGTAKQFTCNVWDRKRWQKTRDGFSVPQGATKVSVGSALDKFHKDRLRGANAAIAASDALLKVLDTYMATISTLKPTKTGQAQENFKGLRDEMRNNLVPKINDYKNQNNQGLQVLQNYATARATFVQQVTQVSQEFSAFHPTPQQATFTPTNVAAVKAAFGPLIKAAGAACYCSTNFPYSLFQAINGSRALADSDNWYGPGVKGLVKVAKELPPTLRL